MKYRMIKLQKLTTGRRKRSLITPARFVFLSYIIIIAIGAFLLSLPVARTQGNFASLLDVLFDSTSAVCVTGFLLSDINANYTIFGQVVLLLLIQIGGLGFMSIATLIFILFGRKVSIQNSMAASESIGEDDFGKITEVIRKISKLTLIVELASFLAMLPILIPEFGAKGAYYSLFLSVSAFTNAGISVLPVNYALNYPLMTVLMTSTLIGGLGYIVIYDLIRRFSPRYNNSKTEGLNRLSTHSKIVLSATLILTLTSTLVYLVGEYNNAFKGQGFFGSAFSALFISINSRSAGFATYDYSTFSQGSRLIIIINMFIGASPASTGGGIKTTTAFVIFAYFLSTIQHKQNLTIFKQTISKRHITKAINVFLFSAITIFIATVALLYVMPNHGLGDILFEVVSSLSTTGKTAGVISDASTLGKIIFIILMLIGRVGILTFGMGFFGKDTDANVKYSEAKILIG